MKSDMELFKASISKSSFIESNSIMSEIESGASIEIRKEIAKAKEEHLSKTYEIRLEHIRSMKGSSHAKRLTESTSEFVKNLNSVEPEFLKTAVVTNKGIGSYLVWLTPDTYNIIGCMYTISQNEVSEKAWEEIWGTN